MSTWRPCGSTWRSRAVGGGTSPSRFSSDEPHGSRALRGVERIGGRHPATDKPIRGPFLEAIRQIAPSIEEQGKLWDAVKDLGRAFKRIASASGDSVDEICKSFYNNQEDVAIIGRVLAPYYGCLIETVDQRIAQVRDAVPRQPSLRRRYRVACSSAVEL